jgi:general secretion pathway protein E
VTQPPSRISTRIRAIGSDNKPAAIQNRRKRDRVIQLTFCNATFLSNGRLNRGLMTDVSSGGAGFRVEDLEKTVELNIDDELKIMVTHIKGETGLHGRVAWVRRNDDNLSFGIEFIEKPSNLDDFTLINLDEVKVDPVWALCVPPNLAVRRQLLPFVCIDDHVYVACQDPSDNVALQAVERYVDKVIRPVRATPDSLKKAISKIFGDSPLGAGSTAASARKPQAEGESESDPVTLCDDLLHAAFLRGASDLHIDPGREGLRVRLRVDGSLEEFRTYPMDIHAELTSRFKVLSGMDIAERRSPQDGRFTHEFGHAKTSVDIRAATLLTSYGERLTLRLLAVQTASLTLEKLGLNQTDRGHFENTISLPHGIILVTGPTGSGKSTTLYAALRRVIGSEDLNIITVEDPVEYDIQGVAQVEVDAADKVTFAKALRSILRHDPDVVMIGEIRDRETADIAVKASLTGHLVLSTLHTNSAASTVTRLIDMGVERYLIAATLKLAMAQRLVRKLCSHCRKPRKLSESEAYSLKRPELSGRTVYEPRGCIYCTGKGFAGRIGVFELLTVDEELSRIIGQGSEESVIVDTMRKQKTNLLVDDAIEKLVGGSTSLGEVLSAVIA